MQSTNYNLATLTHTSLVGSYIKPIFDYQNQAYNAKLNSEQFLNENWDEEKINELGSYFANKEQSEVPSDWQGWLTYIKNFFSNRTKETNIIIRPTKTKKEEETKSSFILDREKRALGPYRTSRNLVMFNQEEELARLVVTYATSDISCISFSATGGEITVNCPLQVIPEIKWFAVRSDRCASLINLIEDNRVRCPNTNRNFLEDNTNTVSERYGIISVNDETKYPDAIYHVIMRNQNEDEIARLYVEENHRCPYGYTFGGKLKVNCPPRPLKEIKRYSVQADRCEPFLSLLERAKVSCFTIDNDFYRLPAFSRNTTNVVRESFEPYLAPYSTSIISTPMTTTKKITKTETVTDITTELSTVTSFRKIPTTIATTITDTVTTTITMGFSYPTTPPQSTTQPSTTTAAPSLFFDCNSFPADCVDRPPSNGLYNHLTN